MRLTIATVGEEWEPNYYLSMEREFHREVVNFMDGWRKRLVEEIRTLAPKATGKLSRSIIAVLDRRLMEIVIQSRLDRAIFQEYGTGIYSDHPDAPGTVIRPKRAKLLRINIGNFRSINSPGIPDHAEDISVRPGKVRAVSAYIFRRSVRGVKPQHYVRRVLDQYEEEIYRGLQDLVRKFEG